LNLCRADKLLLTGSAAVVGSSLLFEPSPLALGVPAAALAAVLTDGIFRPASGALYPTISCGPRGRAEVALTFDDGPDAEVTPRVLDILEQFAARGTFFVIGRHLARHPKIGERAIAAGHELGNHSWTHSYLQNFYPTRTYSADIERNSQLIRELQGTDRQPLYRPPVGLKSPALARAAHAQRLTLVAWSLHSRDTLIRNAKRLASRVLERIRPGDIVLLHDGHERDGRHRPAIIQALPLILHGLRERGLSCVGVRDLLREPMGPSPDDR
jgi:peptidoglycan-N-acetylglucosamine deacetylase